MSKQTKVRLRFEPLSIALLVLMSIMFVPIRNTKIYYCWKSILIIVSLTGFSIQTINVSQTYFDYLTETNTRIENEKLLDPPALSICVRYADMIEPDKLKTVLNQSDLVLLSALMPRNELYEQFIEDHLSVRDYFRLSENLRAKSCQLRLPGRFKVFDSVSEYCHRYLDITKVLMPGYICYQIRPNFTGQYHFST